MIKDHPWDKSLGWFDKLAQKLRPFIPFTALNTVRRQIDKNSKSILDVGCGKGEPMSSINRKGWLLAVGADGFEPYLQECRKTGLFHDLVRCDVRYLPLKPDSFDIVMCMEVLEHLEKEEGESLLASLEVIARKQVILTTPTGKYDQHIYDGNPRQEHKYIWRPNEMTRLGYEVRGCGFARFGGEGGVVSRLPSFCKPMIYLVWILAGPLVYYYPKLSGSLVCIKKCRKNTDIRETRKP